MNKTISINIAGFVFNIEEQAYETLSRYLEDIRKKFSNEAERDEIMDDIELRIAELFQEKISSSKEVIVDSDIDEIMEILGHPEDFATDEEEIHQETNRSEEKQQTQRGPKAKRLFRDRDNSTIGGVCSGLGHYFGVDAVVFRVLFIFLVIIGGSGVLLYLVLLIVIPEAKTTSDKLEMKGQSINVENIKEHVNNFKSNVSDSAKKTNSVVKKTVKETVDKSVKASHSVLEAISKIIGLGFLIGGLIALSILLLIYFGNTRLIPIVGDDIESIPTLIDIIYPGNVQTTFIFIALIIVTTLPLIGLIVAGVRMLFNFRQSIKSVTIGLVVFWFLSVVFLGFSSMEMGLGFRSYNHVKYNVSVEPDSLNTLIVDVADDDVFSNHIDPHYRWNVDDLLEITETHLYLGYPELVIVQKEDSSDFEVTLIKRSNGSSQKDATNKIENIDYKIDVTGNEVLLAPYFSIPREDKFRGQFVTVEIAVPIGKNIKFGDNIDRILEYIPGEYYYWNVTHANTTWHSSRDSLYCIECESTKNEYTSD